MRLLLPGCERGTGECVFLVYPLTQRQAEQPPVVAEPGAIVMSVYGGFHKNLFSSVSGSRCSHPEMWCLISLSPSYLAVTRPVSGCCTWNAGKLDSWEDSAVVRAHSDPELFGLRSHAEWRTVLSRCFSSQSSTRFTWLAVVMMAGQCAGTGPCELVSVTARCIDRCGVATHTSSCVRNNNNRPTHQPTSQPASQLTLLTWGAGAQ